MSECCGSKQSKPPEQEKEQEHACVEHSTVQGGCCESKSSVDYLFWGPLSFVVALYLLHLTGISSFEVLTHLSHSVYTMMNTMAWGLALGIVMVALLSYVPKELVISAMGGEGWRGLLRATAAGVLLDLCSHGILMVGAKLYERGVSIGQVMAFLIASPWNSFSLTLILIAFIGLPWTLAFIGLSLVVALLTGRIFQRLVRRGVLPQNPHAVTLDDDVVLSHELKKVWRSAKFSWSGFGTFLTTGFKESKMVVKWLFIGVVLASLIQVFVDDAVFEKYFGATVLGLLLTMIAATIIEVCSEGSTPIAADIFHRAGAPGNSFAFMMAGVSTDYTEIMVLRERTRSWKLALFLPLISLPQILVIAFIVNSVTA